MNSFNKMINMGAKNGHVGRNGWWTKTKRLNLKSVPRVLQDGQRPPLDVLLPLLHLLPLLLLLHDQEVNLHAGVGVHDDVMAGQLLDKRKSLLIEL